MPYKRNPMRSERICALARYVICDSLDGTFTSAAVVRSARSIDSREQAHFRAGGIPCR